MPRKPKSRAKTSDRQQLELDFNAVISTATVLSREDVTYRRSADDHAEYSPVDRTAEYMQRAVKMEEAWETTVQEAREALMKGNCSRVFLNDPTYGENHSMPTLIAVTGATKHGHFYMEMVFLAAYSAL